MNSIAFIGLGNMGLGMAINLVKNKYDLYVYDIDQKKMGILIEKGSKSVADITHLPDTIKTAIVCLPHPDISKKIIADLTKNKSVETIIETSTLTPNDTNDFYKRLSKLKINYLCAPMLGGKQSAIKAEIHFLIEGDENIFIRYKKIFLSMGNRVDYMGKPPTATLTKLAYNICRYSNVATAAQVSRLVRSYISDTKSIYTILSEGSLDNFGQVWVEDIKEMILNGTEYDTTSIPDKDLSLISNIADNQHVDNSLFLAIKEVYKSLPMKK